MWARGSEAPNGPPRSNGLGFGTSTALMQLRGEVDCAKAHEVRRFLNAMMDIGRRSLPQDLAELDSMDAWDWAIAGARHD